MTRNRSTASRVRFALAVALVVIPALAEAQTFWTGPPVQFTKSAFADPYVPENQDLITATTRITRGSVQGLFNVALEEFYDSEISPANTRWAPGSIADGVGSLTFTDWRTAVGGNPPSALNQPFVLHVVDADIYIDVTLLTWGVGSLAGGFFSYTRSTPPVFSVPSLGGSYTAALALALLAATRFARRRRQC